MTSKSLLDEKAESEKERSLMQPSAQNRPTKNLAYYLTEKRRWLAGLSQKESSAAGASASTSPPQLRPDNPPGVPPFWYMPFIPPHENWGVPRKHTAMWLLLTILLLSNRIRKPEKTSGLIARTWPATIVYFVCLQHQDFKSF